VKAINLLPLGSVDRTLLQRLGSPLRETFSSQVEVRDGCADIRLFLDPVRMQYHSTQIILHVSRLRAEGRCGMTNGHGDKILAVIGEDLFVPVLTYVFGEAQLEGDTAVVSYHRLQNEMYGLPPDPELLFQRLLKEAVHELGHTCGLVHCLTQECVMHTSTYVEDIDLKGWRFCSSCTEILRSRG